MFFISHKNTKHTVEINKKNYKNYAEFKVGTKNWQNSVFSRSSPFHLLFLSPQYTEPCLPSLPPHKTTSPTAASQKGCLPQSSYRGPAISA